MKTFDFPLVQFHPNIPLVLCATIETKQQQWESQSNIHSRFKAQQGKGKDKGDRDEGNQKKNDTNKRHAMELPVDFHAWYTGHGTTGPSRDREGNQKEVATTTPEYNTALHLLHAKIVSIFYAWH